MLDFTVILYVIYCVLVMVSMAYLIISNENESLYRLILLCFIFSFPITILILFLRSLSNLFNAPM